jgi:sugar phosphate isomerase/epimerase
MKLGLSTLLFPKVSIEDAVKTSAELGAECIEIIFDLPHFPPEYELRTLGDLKGIIDSYELEVAVHASLWDLNPASHYRAIRDLTIVQVKRSIDACRLLGGEIVVTHPGHCPAREVEGVLKGTRSRFREFVEACWRHARELGITFTVENVDRADFPYSTVEELKQLAEGFEGLGITYDVGHAYLARRKEKLKDPEADIAGAIKKAGELLIHVHLHDNRGFKDDHLPPGEGEIDFEPILGVLKDIGYRGHLIAELWGPENSFEVGRKGLERIKQMLKQR